MTHSAVGGGLLRMHDSLREVCVLRQTGLDCEQE
jgi:hypothetical protein